MANSGGANLASLELSLGGNRLLVKAGAMVSIHPDAPFKVLAIRTNSWLNFGLSAYLPDFPHVDLKKFHTLQEIMGDSIYQKNQVVIQAFKKQQPIGQVTLLVRLLPIDWLRRAEQAGPLREKIKYTAKALELVPDDHLVITRMVDLLTEARRYKEAVALLEKQAAFEENPAWLTRLARLYRDMGRTRKEAAILSKLLASGPPNPQMLKRLATLLQKQKKWTSATRVLNRLLKLSDDNQKAVIYRNIGQIWELAGNPAKAAQAWNHALELTPSDSKLWLALARSREKSGDQAGTLEALKQASSLRPRDRELLLELAQAYFAQPDDRAGAQTLEKILALTPGDVTVLNRLVNIYKRLNDRPALINTYKRLAQTQSGNKEIQFNLALLQAQEYKDQGDLKQSLEALKRALAITPKSMALLRQMDQIYEQTNDLAGRVEAHRRMAELSPNDPDLYYNLALLAFRLPNLELAGQSLARAMVLKPEDVQFKELGLEIYARQGDFEKLADVTAKLLALSQEPDGVLGLIYPLLEKEHPDQLANILNLFIKRFPKEAKLYELATALALEREDPQEAAALLKAGADALPDNLALRFKLAQLYETQDEPQKAMEALELVLDKDPDYPGAGELYLNLKTRNLQDKTPPLPPEPSPFPASPPG